jgi:hypothetical protein
MLDLPSDIEC